MMQRWYLIRARRKCGIIRALLAVRKELSACVDVSLGMNFSREERERVLENVVSGSPARFRC